MAKRKIQKWRIRLSVASGIIFFAFTSVTNSRWENDASWVTALLMFLGLLLVSVASLGRLWCSAYIAGYKTRRLITVGPYSLSRNPLYFFSLIGFVGVGLVSETLVMPAILMLVFALYYPIVIRAEEQRLRSVHGDQYEEYAKSTPLFFPTLARPIEPEVYDMNPRVFRRHLIDAFVFVWCAGLLEIFEQMRELEWIPTVFTVY